MREQELRKLIVEEFLAFTEDPRVERTRKHSLENILVISLLAVIAGADSFVAIENFARLKRDWLATFLDFEDVPSHDTIGRVFAALDTRALSEAFARWTLAMRATSDEKLIAIGGKALRRSFRRAGDSASSTWCPPGPRRITSCWAKSALTRSPTRSPRYPSSSICSKSRGRS